MLNATSASRSGSGKMQSWCMHAHASPSGNVPMQSWCMRAHASCFRCSRCGTARAHVCFSLKKKKNLGADAVLVHASACQRIQRCGGAVLVYAARMPVHPAQRGRSPGVCSACQYVQCSKKKKTCHKCASSPACVKAKCVVGIWTYAGAYPVPPAISQPPLVIARIRVPQPRHAQCMVARLWA